MYSDARSVGGELTMIGSSTSSETRKFQQYVQKKLLNTEKWHIEQFSNSSPFQRYTHIFLLESHIIPKRGLQLLKVLEPLFPSHLHLTHWKTDICAFASPAFFFSYSLCLNCFLCLLTKAFLCWLTNSWCVCFPSEPDPGTS